MSDITPKYTDEEIFQLITMQFGVPPTPVAPGYRHDPRRHTAIKREADYYNDVTSFLMAIQPRADIVWISDTRRRYYGEHGIFHFDSA